MYLTESDRTHTCTVAIVTKPMVAKELADEFATRDGEPLNLQEPVNRLPPMDQPELDKDRVVGRYRLVRCLGRGTTGSVWLAQDMTKADRDVALKIMHADEHDEHVLARYTCEVRALARMDDPHIARIWENGQTADGKLYIAMELIQGVHLSKYCEAWSPTVRERIALTINICRGLQHAHQRGILHRDLKPANILVSHHDGAVIPKIIDFGLAKSIHKPLMPGSPDTTQMGCLLGTIGYMSPEQANIANREVDTRSDVYSVCAILYELLTGTLPIQRELLNRLSLAQALEMIQHKDPELASRRALKQSQLTMQAARCQTTPVQLVKQLQGDLDSILQKGLSKERELRYQSAGELADDLERYLTGGVVHARPRTVWYVAQKLMRRHWKAALAASVLTLLFLVSWVGLALGIVWAVEAKDKAQQAEEATRVAQERERRHKEDAESANSFLEQVFRTPRPNELGEDVKLLDALDASATKLSTSFAQQPRAERMARLALARSYLRLGRSQKAQDLVRPIIENRRLTSDDSRLQLMQSENLYVQTLLQQEKYAAAEAHCRELLDSVLEQKAAPVRMQILSLYQSFAKAMVKQNKPEEAIRLLEKALTTVVRPVDEDSRDVWQLRCAHASSYVEWASREKSKIDEAIEVTRDYLDRARVLPAKDPLLFQLQGLMSQLFTQSERYTEAQLLLETMLASAHEHFGVDHMQTQSIYSNLFQLYLKNSQYGRAREILTWALSWQVPRLGLAQEVTQHTLENLVDLCVKLGDLSKALEYCDQLYNGQCESLGKTHPKAMATWKRCHDLAVLVAWKLVA